MICQYEACKRNSIEEFQGKQYCEFHLNIVKNIDNFGDGYGYDNETEKMK